MSWFTNTTLFHHKKIKASKIQIQQDAINAINSGADPKSVLQNFVSSIKQEDPAFNIDMAQALSSSNNPQMASNFISGFNFAQNPQIPGGQGIIDTQFEAQQPSAESTPEGVEEGPKPEEVGEGKGEDPADAQQAAKAEEEEGIEGVSVALTQQSETGEELDPTKKYTVDPTILDTFEIPTNKLMDFQKKLGKYNAALIRSANEPWTMELVGSQVKPQRFPDGSTQDIEFSKIKVKGVLPHTSETGEFKIRKYRTNKRGEQVVESIDTETKGFRAIGQVMFHALTPEEQQKHLNNPKTNPHLINHIKSCIQKGEVPFYNTIDKFHGAPTISPRFYTTPNTLCDMCKNKQQRGTGIIVSIVDPDIMQPMFETIRNDMGELEKVPLMYVDRKTGKKVQRKTVPESAIKNAPQAQLGGSCAQLVDINLMENLKKWIHNAKNPKVEKQPAAENPNARHEPWYAKSWKMMLPSNTVFANIIYLLRDAYKRSVVDRDIQSNQKGNLRNIGRTAAHRAYYYDVINQNKQVSDYVRRNAQSYVLPISEEDLQIAQDVRNWWINKFGGMALDQDTRNKINYGIRGNLLLEEKGLPDLVSMVGEYLTKNNIQLKPIERKKPQTTTPSGSSPFGGKALPAQPTPTAPAIEEKKEEPLQSTPQTGAGISDLDNLTKGDDFLAQLTHKYSKEWSTKKGVSHIFSDTKGRKYVIFDRYPSGQKIPNMNFQQGNKYYLKGKVGDYSHTWKTTQLDAKPVNENELNSTSAPSPTTETPTVSPEKTTAPTAPISPTVPTETPPIQTEKPTIPTKTEAPSGEKKEPELIGRAMKALTSGRDNLGKPIDPKDLFKKFLTYLSKYHTDLKDEDTQDNLIADLVAANEYDERDQNEWKPLVKDELMRIYNAYAPKQ